MFSSKDSGWSKYLVGRVSVRAQVEATGNTLLGLKYIAGGISKPSGGGYSAPEKNPRTCPRVTSGDSESAKQQDITLH